MIHRVLQIGRWTVDFLFAETKYDVEGVVGCLRYYLAPDLVIDEAVSLMEEGGMNTGFFFNNPEIFKALLVVGPTSSGAEFLNTITHEIHHLAVAVASQLGVELNSESPAYLAGDSAMALAEVVCELGCEHCRGVK